MMKRSYSSAALLDDQPIIGPMLTRAAEEGKPVSSDPLELVRKGGPMGVVLAAAVRGEGSDAVAGFLTISYRLAPLMLANDELSLFSVALRDPRDAANNLSADTNGNVLSVPLQLDADNPPLLRVVSFGSRDWTLIYYAKSNVGAHAQEVAAIVLSDRRGTHHDPLWPVRLCLVQQHTAESRDRNADRLRAAVDSRY